MKEKPTGVLSPWNLHTPKEKPIEERLLENARVGKTAVSVRGGRYTILVTVQARFKEAKDTQDAAAHMLGEFLAAERVRLEPHLRLQKIGYEERDVLSAAIRLEFGRTALWAASSSSNEKLAQQMAVDRLAQAFTWYRHADGANKNALSKHCLEIIRES